MKVIKGIAVLLGAVGGGALVFFYGEPSVKTSGWPIALGVMAGAMVGMFVTWWMPDDLETEQDDLPCPVHGECTCDEDDAEEGDEEEKK